MSSNLIGPTNMEILDVVVNHEQYSDGHKNHMWSERDNCEDCKIKIRAFDKEWMKYWKAKGGS